MRLGWAFVVVAGCGFSPTLVTGDAPGDDATVKRDGSGGPPVVTSFGEQPTCDHMGVTTDTYVESADIAMNFGTEAGVWADASPTTNGLVRFDVSALPPSTVVTAAELEVTTTTDSLESGTLATYEALEAWDPDTATWLERTSGVTWTTAGASPPGSRGAVMLGSVFPSLDLTTYTFAIDAATVQRWIAMPATNLGMVVISTSPTGAGVTVSSSRSPTATSRPVLRVTH